MSNSKEIIGGEVRFGGRAVPLSWAVRAGDFVFVSGIVACDDNGILSLGGDIGEQTQLALRFIQKRLMEADCDLGDVAKVSVFLKNPDDFESFNEVYAGFFPEQPPARITVTGGFVVEGALVEIEVTAYKPRVSEK